MDHICIDVHKKESQICILAEGGELIEQRVRTEPERFAAVFGGRPRAWILIGASTDSEWVARCLEGLSHELIVADSDRIGNMKRHPEAVVPSSAPVNLT